MGDVPADTIPLETPWEWMVCFHTECVTPWVRWIPGRYKHVTAFAFVRQADVIVYVDPSIDWMRVSVVKNEDADALLAYLSATSTIVHINLQRKTGRHWRLGWWCVPTVAHMLGIRSSAVRPDGLLRELLRQGGEIISCSEASKPRKTPR